MSSVNSLGYITKSVPIGSSMITASMLEGSIGDTKLDTIATTGKVSNSATTATTAATANKIVLRDSGGGIYVTEINGAPVPSAAVSEVNTGTRSAEVVIALVYSSGPDVASTARYVYNIVGDMITINGTFQLFTRVGMTYLTVRLPYPVLEGKTYKIDTSTVDSTGIYYLYVYGDVRIRAYGGGGYYSASNDDVGHTDASTYYFGVRKDDYTAWGHTGDGTSTDVPFSITYKYVAV